MNAFSKPRNVNGNFGTSDLRMSTYAATQENKEVSADHNK
jgi:hypothetical protein